MSSSAFSADDRYPVSPPVIGPEQFDEHDERGKTPKDGELALPDPVFVPTAWAPDDEGMVEIQLRRTDQDELALPVYSSAESLAACCGGDQSWVAFPGGIVPELVTATEATGIILDPNLREGNLRDG